MRGEMVNPETAVWSADPAGAEPVGVKISETDGIIKTFGRNVSLHNLEISLFGSMSFSLPQQGGENGARIMAPSAAGRYIDSINSDIITITDSKTRGNHSAVDFDTRGDGVLRDGCVHVSYNPAKLRIAGSVEMEQAVHPFFRNVAVQKYGERFPFSWDSDFLCL